jgi:hypothetical protein
LALSGKRIQYLIAGLHVLIAGSFGHERGILALEKLLTITR